MIDELIKEYKKRTSRKPKWYEVLMLILCGIGILAMIILEIIGEYCLAILIGVLIIAAILIFVLGVEAYVKKKTKYTSRKVLMLKDCDMENLLKDFDERLLEMEGLESLLKFLEERLKPQKTKYIVLIGIAYLLKLMVDIFAHTIENNVQNFSLDWYIIGGIVVILAVMGSFLLYIECQIREIVRRKNKVLQRLRENLVLFKISKSHGNKNHNLSDSEQIMPELTVEQSDDENKKRGRLDDINNIILCISAGIVLLMLVFIVLLKIDNLLAKYVVIAYLIGTLTMLIFLIIPTVPSEMGYKQTTIWSFLTHSIIYPVDGGALIGIVLYRFIFVSKDAAILCAVSMLLMIAIFSLSWFSFQLKKDEDNVTKLELYSGIMVGALTVLSLAMDYNAIKIAFLLTITISLIIQSLIKYKACKISS